MNYALNLGENGRVLSVTFPRYAPEGSPLVESLPDGNVSDYRYVDGGFVHDPLPESEPELGSIEVLTARADETDAALALKTAQVQAIVDRADFVEDCIAEMAMRVYGGV